MEVVVRLIPRLKLFVRITLSFFLATVLKNRSSLLTGSLTQVLSKNKSFSKQVSKWSKLSWKDITALSLPMVRLELVRLTL